MSPSSYPVDPPDNRSGVSRPSSGPFVLDESEITAKVLSL